jgi:murein DD-endopeptidase MepM/ murein hydrolase activator NlpD
MKHNWHKWSIFDKHVVSRIFALPMAGLATAMSLVVYPTHAFDYSLAQNNAAEQPIVVVTSTNSQYHFPLSGTLGMSQTFGPVHPGVDLRAPKGTPILAMDNGIVIDVEYTMVGYGHFVRIAHSGTTSTLYAHMDQVAVKPGQKVTRGEKIGDVGVTGWTTGPHLHFEVHQGEVVVNPLSYIGNVFTYVGKPETD